MDQTLTDKVFYLAVAGFVAGVFFRSFVEIGAAFSGFFVLLGAVLFILPFLKRVAHSDEPRDLTIPALARTNFAEQNLRGRADSSTPFSKGNKSSVPHHFSEKVGDTSPPGRLESFSRAGFKKGGILAAVFLLAAGLGMLRYDFAERDNRQSESELFVHQTVTLEGIITDEPDVRESATRLILQTDGAKVLLTVSHEPRFLYGDKVKVEGKLERPRNFKDEVTLREVDYISHLAKDGILYEMFRPKITLLAHGQGNRVVEKLFTFKNAFIENINTLIPQPHASLLGGLVVGAKQSLGKELLNDFRTVGVIHIVVLSGYNITIIAVFIEWLLSRLRKNLRLIFAAFAMILFALMVGASATVIRATAMALLVLLARGTGRIYAVTRALLVAGVIMLLHNPKILVFDTSFQLSFLATVGLIYLSPFIEPKVRWVTERWNIHEIFVATVATQLFVLPFLLYKTGILSLVSLPVNLLILAAVPLTMLFGFLTGLTGFVWNALAAPFAFVSYAFLAYELAVVEWFARLPFAAVSIPQFPLWLVVLWYALYAWLYFLWRSLRTEGNSCLEKI